MMLSSTARRLWEEYLACESRGVRAERNESLQRFLDAAILDAAIGDAQPTDEFALDLVKRKVDGGEDIPIRMPLFRKMIFPALQRGLNARSGDCARWLAGLAQLLYKSPDCLAAIAPLESERDLLVRALEYDPSDFRSRQRLVDRDAWYLAYTLHELPAGVLYGTDGASPAQCLELDDFLDKFRDSAEIVGVAAEHQQLIDRCRLHYRAYREYLLERRESDYASFLQRRGLAESS